MGCSNLPSAAALLLGMLGALLSACPSSVSASGYEAAFLHKPELVGRSNYTHFWMITSSTPTSLLPSASIRLEIMLHGDSGPWGKCPNPRHPQNCTAQYTNRGGEWRDIMQTDNPVTVPGNAPIRLSQSQTRGFAGTAAVSNNTATLRWQRWEEDPSTGAVRVLDDGTAYVTGLPPLASRELVLLPSLVRLPGGTGPGEVLAAAYSTAVADKAAGAGNRTCVGIYKWQAHFCSTLLVLASADEGLSWQYRSRLQWSPAMGHAVEGPDEGALTLLPDNRTLLAVFRVQEHRNYWQATSTDGGRSWGAAAETNAWSVFPQLQTLRNGATVLAGGRPGLGLWLLTDAANASWRFYNLAAAHNAACASAGGCGANSTYDSYTCAIHNCTPDGGHSDWRRFNVSTPPFTKAYFGLTALNCSTGGLECDVMVTYDRDANGGEGPGDCNGCPKPDLHGLYDQVFAMRVTVRHGGLQAASGRSVSPAAVHPAVTAVAVAADAPDPRAVRAGTLIWATDPGNTSVGYADQPQICVLPSGRWVCMLTCAASKEGSKTQRVVATWSDDFGKSWSPAVTIDGGEGVPSASWVNPFVAAGGRLYAIYTYNSDNVTQYPTHPALPSANLSNSNLLGGSWMRWSEDAGETWSRARLRVPTRVTHIDQVNDFGGRTLEGWSVGKPFQAPGSPRMFLQLTKLSRMQPASRPCPTDTGCATAWLLSSPNLATEPDPTAVRWDLLPEGDAGVRAVSGPVAEEGDTVPLSGGGALHMVIRANDSCISTATSRDGGKSWSSPAHARYAESGAVLLNPSGPLTPRRLRSGRFLLLFYNRRIPLMGEGGYFNNYGARNPYWLAVGREHNGTVVWSQPEVALYTPYNTDQRVAQSGRPGNTVGYPDIVELPGSGDVVFTSTDKIVARLHRLDPALLAGLLTQHTAHRTAERGLALNWTAPLPGGNGGSAPAPSAMPDLNAGGGFSLEVLFFESAAAGQGDDVLLVTCRGGDGGIELRLEGGRLSLSLSLSLGTTLTTQPLPEPHRGTTPSSGSGSRPRHVVWVVDGAAQVASVLVDGTLLDGGGERSKGFDELAFLPQPLPLLGGGRRCKFAVGVQLTRLYTRYLTTSEAVGNYRSTVSQRW